MWKKNFTKKEAEELLETCDILSKRYEIEKSGRVYELSTAF
ncbi:hypothetical protein RCO48_01360 [Peribacillus frigoritolerans]|nr:hypothetical protein [Peribacillus frigoritolerans]